jgi:hypothetical protein
MRALLAKAAVEDLEVEQIDVKTTFLNGPLKKEIYMEPPAGYNFGNKVLILRKALDGLKQAAQAWNEELIVGVNEDVAAVMCALEHFDLRKLGPATYFLSMEII